MIDKVQIKTLNPLESWFKPTTSIDTSEQILNLILQKNTNSNTDFFLNPRISDIPSPGLLKNIDAATELFIECVNNNKRIIVAGDYDVDGITSVALFIRLFHLIQYSNFGYFIPNRFQHGYGISEKSIESLIAFQPDLIVTVDNGIAAKKEIDHLKSQKIQVIVTDHHTPQKGLIPDCLVINPKLAGSKFPYNDISGVGTAFLFIIALRTAFRNQGFWNNSIPEPNLLEHLDLVTLGTVADQVPLLGLNRLFVKFGLEQMSRKIQMPDPGSFFSYLKIFAESNNTKFFNCDTINFKFAPLLNAAGRMKDATLALDFLLPAAKEKSLKSYLILEKLNKSRKQLQQRTILKARKLAEEKIKHHSALVLYDKGFHEGIIGIIANRLSEIFKVPVCVFTDNEDGQSLKGSCRSDHQDILLLLKGCERSLIKFGGHSKAAGCSIEEKLLAKFEKEIDEQCKLVPLTQDYNELITDVEILPDMATPELYDKMRLMEPFGQDNQKPVFMLKNQELSTPIQLSGNHIKWNLNRRLELIFWEGRLHFKETGAFHIAATLKDNTFRGVRKVQLVVKAMTPIA